jgi:hypothetical protein
MNIGRDGICSCVEGGQDLTPSACSRSSHHASPPFAGSPATMAQLASSSMPIEFRPPPNEQGAQRWYEGEGKEEMQQWNTYIANAVDTSEWLDAVVLQWRDELGYGVVLPVKTLEICPTASDGVRRRECGVHCPAKALPAADGIGVPVQLMPGGEVQVRLSAGENGRVSVWRARAGSAADDGTARFPYETAPSPVQGIMRGQRPLFCFAPLPSRL